MQYNKLKYYRNNLDDFQAQLNKVNTWTSFMLSINLTRSNSSWYKKLAIQNNLDFSHFKTTNKKLQRISKECPVCKNTFVAKKGSTKERTTCSKSCANSYFRSGRNHPNWTGGGHNYRKLAFDAYISKCNRCNYDLYTEILEVHHKDCNRKNNNIDNLEILCPNCHAIEHFKTKTGKYTPKKKK